MQGIWEQSTTVDIETMKDEATENGRVCIIRSFTFYTLI